MLRTKTRTALWYSLPFLMMFGAIALAQSPAARRADERKLTAKIDDKKAEDKKGDGKKADDKKGALESKLSPTEEHKIFAQLLEYLHRDTFPPGETQDPDLEPRGSSQVKMFIEQRRKMIGYIRTRMRDMRADPDLIELYDEYLLVLDEADRYGNELRKLEEDYYKGILRIREDTIRKMKAFQLRMAANVIQKNAWVQAHSVGGWWGWGRGWYARGLMAGTILSAGNIVAADLRTQARFIEFIGAMKNAIENYETVNKPRLFNDMRNAERQFIASLENKRSKILSKGNTNIDNLIKKFNWNATDVTLRPFDEVKSNNPFVPLSALNRLEDIKSAKQADACEQAARELLALVDKLPHGNARDSSHVHNRVRADIAFMACMHANRAAEFQLGGDAFSVCVKSPVPAGKVALDAYKMYADALNHLPQDEPHPRPRAEEKYQEALAWAYSGKAQKASVVINEILPKDLSGMDNPKFYFDSARLRCLGDNDGVKLGLRYLNTAFMIGYKNAEKARVAPDLELLRKVAPNTFDAVIALNKDKAKSSP